MGAISAYAISVAIILAMEYIVYKSLLANATFYRFNRAVLLLCYLIALVALPISRLLPAIAHASGGINIGEPIVTAITEEEVANSFNWVSIVPIIYFAGAAVMAIVTIISYVRMARIIRCGEHSNLGDAVMVIAKTKVSPFSWGKYLVVSPADADNELIIEHELTHIRNHHSIDLLFAQLFIIFNWFNPVAYLMRRELSAVHEYDVDKQILRSGVDARAYQMLLIKKTVGPGFQSIANSLNHSQLKNRLTMMLKSKSKTARRLCAAVLLPAAVLAVAMTDFPAVASTIGSIASVSYGKGSESSSNPQVSASSAADDDAISTVDVAGVMPEYPGGLQAAMQAIMAEAKWPENVTPKEGYDGLVVVGFTVMKDGSVKDVKLVKSCGYGDLDAMAMKAVEKAFEGKKWTPGMTDGKPVNCSFAIPIRFATK